MNTAPEGVIIKIFEPDVFVVLLNKLPNGNYTGVVEYTNYSHLIIVKPENIDYVCDEMQEQQY